MKTALRYLDLVLLFVALSVIFSNKPAEARDDEEVTLVGRISHVEGKLLRYVEEENDWVLTVKDAPFGLNDALYAGDFAKAEFMMPNRTWMRTGENTQVQLIDLNPDATTVDVASGLARLYNKSDDVVIKVTTPFGYVVAPGGTVFDLYVGDVSLEVIAVDGDVDFVHSGTNARYEVLEGYSSIIADEREVASGNGTVDAEWDDWNRERDELWETRLRRSKSSAGYLPESIREESYYLEENGRWERIYYEGAYRDMWRPTRIERGWRPFTAGRWTVYYGDNCWVPDEPFGYVTHHYGSWIYVETHRAWFWLPPVARFVADTPRFFISFGWHPGRVGWIHSGPSIGWVPLAWDEEYYGHRHWGPRTVIVRPYTVININIHRYRFIDEAVVIPRDRFYRGTRYTPFVQREVSRDIIVNNYQPVTVINNTVINNYNVDRRRFAFNDVEVDRKPHVTVVNRINANQRTISGIDRIGRERIERDLTRLDVRSEPPRQKADVPRPVLTTKLVEPDNVAKPITALDLKKKEIKPRERERQIAAGTEDRRPPSERGREERIRKEERTGQQPVVREQERIRQPGEEQRPAEELERQQAEEPQQVREPGQTEEKPRLRSPREKGEEVERGQRPQDQVRQPEAGPRPRPQEQEIERQQAEEVRGRREPQRPSERRDQAEEPQQVQKPDQTEEKPRLRSPREKGEEVERGPRPRDQVNQPEAGSRPRPQEQEIERQQAEEVRGRREPQRPVERRDQAEEPQQVREPGQTEEKPRLRSPRDRDDQQQAAEAARKKKEDEGARQQEQAR
ncbi:MAG TPA: hypothetical protein DDY32_08145, partial [Desulfobulbaceae bacterium]|nr:hypothetical protein [Desulfobulbaceae bacterium]